MKKIEDDVTNVSYEVKTIGCYLYVIVAIPNIGKDFMIGKSYTDIVKAKAIVRELRAAYKLGKIMQARSILNSVNRRAGYRNDE